MKELGSRKLLDGMQDSGAGVLSPMGNYGEQNPDAAIFYLKGDRVLWRLVKRVDGLNALGLGEEMVFSNREDSNDVIDAFRVNDRYGVLVEYFTGRQNWRLRIAMCGAYLALNARGLSASLPMPFNDGHSNFGHPSFTTGPDGKPKVLFSFFMSHAPPFPVVDYSRQWRHEIWSGSRVSTFSTPRPMEGCSTTRLLRILLSTIFSGRGGFSSGCLASLGKR